MPVDSDFFNGINSVQWAWYQIQYWLDEKEEFELFRDVAEHNAMFSNPDGVRQIRESRENSYKMKDEDFTGFIKDLFGRDMSDETRPFNKQDIGTDLKPYFDLDLDEIKFTPYEDR